MLQLYNANILSTCLILHLNVIGVLCGSKKGCDVLIHSVLLQPHDRVCHMSNDDLIFGLILRAKESPLFSKPPPICLNLSPLLYVHIQSLFNEKWTLETILGISDPEVVSWVKLRVCIRHMS